MHNDSKKLIITGEKGHRSIFWNQSYRFWGLVLQHLVGPQKRIQQAFHTLAGSLYNLRRKEAASHCSGQSGAGVSCWHFSLCVVPYIYICSQSFLGWNASTREGLGTVIYSCDSCSLVTQLCLTVCDSMNCGLPGSSVHGIFQARTLEWVPFPSWGELPNPGVKPRSPVLQAASCSAGGYFADAATLKETLGSVSAPLLREQWSFLVKHESSLSPTDFRRATSFTLSLMGKVYRFVPNEQHCLERGKHALLHRSWVPVARPLMKLTQDSLTRKRNTF